MMQHGRVGEIYNVGTGVEKTVEEIADGVLGALGLSQSLKTYVPDRPGHDRRYLLDSTKVRRELGWKPVLDFTEGLRETVRWYAENKQWWQALKERDAIQEGNWANPKCWEALGTFINI
jgi:dTDP-glucose 4,6-dehydratase